MQFPVYRPSLSTGETIIIDLIELTTMDETGGSPIDSYKVELSEADSGVWSTVSGSPSLQTQVSILGLTVGSNYKFRA
jgi:hypothetical protein